MALLTTVSNLDRLRQIVLVLGRHGFGELLARTELGGLIPFRKSDDAARPRVSFAERTRLAMQELGPSFVKLGQILSTRADLLPPDLILELKKLQEDVPPIAFEEVRRTIEETCGSPLAEVFAEFDERPLASASIGQVHRAKLKTEAGIVDVAVKVQRPNIRGTIERDLDLLYLMARLIERAVPESTIYSPTRLVAEFDRSIMAELDYTIEGGNAAKFTRNFDGNETVRFPRVYAEVSGKKVLVAEFFDGLKIADATAQGYSGERIAKNSVQIIAQMIFVDGLFHADPHPGNIRVLGTPEVPVVGMLDLGMVGVLSSEMRDRAIDLMMAAIKKDVDELADALIAMGRPRDKVDRDAFRAEVARLSEVHLGKPIKEIQLAAMIRDLVQGAVKFEIEMPAEMMMVGKSLMTVEGIGKSIYPDLDVFEEARPFFLKLLWQRYSPEKVGGRMLKAASKLSAAAVDLPPLLAEVLDDLRRGRLKLRAEDPGLERAAERLGRRVALGLMGAAWIGCGTAALLQGHEQACWVLFTLALVFALAAWGRLPLPGKRK
ncbi:MAG: AarF/ABC1/UbiB kinase family protein [Myxococcales bacterium]|nr:AarF/ABC1/UbiB kinase family protein [Myxococcales bacterium]